jgi:hypothetical protein
LVDGGWQFFFEHGNTVDVDSSGNR